MNRSFLIFAFLFLFLTTASAQRPTGISPQMLDELRTCCPTDAHFRSGQNALAQTDGRKLTPDWQKINNVDPHFSTRLKDQKVTDQKSSGRCKKYIPAKTLAFFDTRAELLPPWDPMFKMLMMEE